MRANTNVSRKDLKVLRLDDFKGVDFSSSPLRVQSNRASYMTNFINENGVNKKRNGWNTEYQIGRYTDDSPYIPQNINNMFVYTRQNGYREWIIHAGRRIFSMEYGNPYAEHVDIMESSTYEPADVNPDKIEDKRSSHLFQGKRAYLIGCGDFLVYGTWNSGDTYELRRVANNIDTYVPLTTTSIDADGVTDTVRATVEDVNLLNSKRKNGLVGHEPNTTIGGESGCKWTLDAPVKSLSSVFITVSNVGGATFILSGTTSAILNGVGDSVGWIDVAAETNGVLNLKLDTEPDLPNSSNITIEFETANSLIAPNRSARIAECNFGIEFGANGKDDRLFLSGNTEFKNIDFFSASDNYTYFGDQNTTALGSDQTAIMGYSRLSDSTLAIHKEGNGQEANIYYRTGYDKEITDSNGNFVKMQSIFPITTGTVGEAVVSSRTCVNFNGDNLILSNSGIYGIVMSSNIASSERYARERSRTINADLMKRNLSEAVCAVHQNRYYLAVEGVCYVADARYKYTPADSVDGSYNYEWWYWDNIPARTWFSYDGKLYFGTEEGWICSFDNEYVDRSYTKILDGDLSVDAAQNHIDCRYDLDIAEGDILQAPLEILVIDTNKDGVLISEGKIFAGEKVFERIYEGMGVLVDADQEHAGSLSANGVDVLSFYTIVNIDRGELSFQLAKGETIISLVSVGFYLYEEINHGNLYITNVDKANHTFQVKKYPSDTVPVVLLRFMGGKLFATIRYLRNVAARWYTPIFDMGTNESSKTLLKMTVSTEPDVNGKLSFGYETRMTNKLLASKGMAYLSFDDLSFENFSFETNFANSYSIKAYERNFNFIVFRFVSDNEYNCSINNFTAVYKINQANKGVR